MKKLTCILALLVCVLLSAAGAEAATPYYYPRDLRLVRVDTGEEIPNGGTIVIEPNETLEFAVYAADTNGDGVVTLDDYAWFTLSGDKGVTVGLADASQGNVNGVNSHYSLATPVYPTDRLGSIRVTATSAVDTIILYQLGYTDNNESEVHYTNDFRVHFKSSYTPYSGYLFVPKSISIRTASGGKVSSVEMRGGTTRTYQVWVDDLNGDGVIDEFDYDVFAISSYQMVPTVESESDTDLRGTTTTPSLLGDTPQMQRYPTRIGSLTVSAINIGGDEGEDYNPVYTSFYYQLTLGGTTGNGLSVGSLLPNSGVLETQTVSVRINALDDGDDGGGGTCDAIGAGALMLLALPLFFRRGRK